MKVTVPLWFPRSKLYVVVAVFVIDVAVVVVFAVAVVE